MRTWAEHKCAQAQKALKLLLRLGLIRKDKSGRYELTEKFVTTGEEWKSLAIQNIQREFLRLGLEALDRFTRDDRDISMLTLSASKETIEAIGDRLRDVRKEIMDMVSADEKTDGVFQVNFQVFPLSKPESGV